MIAVAVGYNAVPYTGQIQSAVIHVRQGVRRKIDQQLVVHRRLGTGAQVPSSRLGGPAGNCRQVQNSAGHPSAAAVPKY